MDFLQKYSNLISLNRLLKENIKNFPHSLIIGSISLVANYRPASNILSVAKLFELYILQRLKGVDLDILMGISQNGFQKRHSLVTAITQMVDTISESLDNKNKV